MTTGQYLIPVTRWTIYRKGRSTYANNNKGLNVELHREPAPAVATEGYRLGNSDGWHNGFICGLVVMFAIGTALGVVVWVMA
jgi:hypothetical protein